METVRIGEVENSVQPAAVMRRLTDPLGYGAAPKPRDCPECGEGTESELGRATDGGRRRAVYDCNTGTGRPVPGTLARPQNVRADGRAQSVPPIN